MLDYMIWNICDDDDGSDDGSDDNNDCDSEDNDIMISLCSWSHPNCMISLIYINIIVSCNI